MVRRGLGLILGLLILLVAHPIYLGFLGDWLNLREPLQPADLILVLDNDRSSVPEATAQLYHQGWATRVLLIAEVPERLVRLGLQPAEIARTRAALHHLGVPTSAFAVLGPVSRSEVAVGRALATYALGKPLRVLVVTATPWARLMRYDLRQGLGNAPVTLAFWSAPSSRFGSHWWQYRQGWLAHFDLSVLALRRYLGGGDKA